MIYRYSDQEGLDVGCYQGRFDIYKMEEGVASLVVLIYGEFIKEKLKIVLPTIQE